MSRLTERLRIVTLLGCAAFLAASPALAQCPVPDNLDGPAGSCCTPAQPTLPPFPAFSQDVLDICWKDCQQDAVLGCVAEWTAPVPAQTATIPPICTVFVSKLRLFDSAGNLKWSGKLRLWYSRTWGEVGPSGSDIQVWRFLVNGDMKPQPAAGAPPCPVPPCAASTGNRVRFTGYLDYAQDCSTGAFEFAWMLNHECDRLDHRVGFPRAGTFHPDRSYTFVGPAAGFVVSPLLPVESGTGSPFEAVRRMDLPVPGTTSVCYFEEPLQSVDVTPLFQRCVCGPGSAPAQYVFSDLRILGTCGTSVFAGTQFPKGFLSKGIGSWTDPTRYPGPEDLRWNMGGYGYDDCNGVFRGEVFFGATTMQGYPAFQILSGVPGTALPLTFIDQGNSLKFPANTTTMNIPYASDHILNLNLP